LYFCGSEDELHDRILPKQIFHRYLQEALELEEDEINQEEIPYFTFEVYDYSTIGEVLARAVTEAN